MIARPARWLSLASVLVVGCAESSVRQASTPGVSTSVAPDLHGDPLGLLPSGAVAWARLDMATLRHSEHFDGSLDLARTLGADLDTLRRELGFDVFHQATMAAVAIYLPPGTGGDQGWPVLYARGQIQRGDILEAARARLPAGTEAVEATEAGFAYTALGARAYMFPAPDVVLVMDRALVRRVAARLAGEDVESVLTDRRFTALWALTGGIAGGMVLATDLAALRGRSPGAASATPREASALEFIVARADLSPGLTVHVAARTRDEAGAQTLVQVLDEARHQAAGQIGARLLRLSHLLDDGVVTSSNGRFVRAEATASDEETGRLLRAASLLHEFSGSPPDS